MPQLFDHKIADQHRRRAVAFGKAGADFLLRRRRCGTGRAPVGGAASLRSRCRPDDATAKPCRSACRQRAGRLHDPDRPAAADQWPKRHLPSPTARRCRLAPPVSISSSRRWHCTAPTTCPGALAQIRFALKPDGLFLAVLFGGDTLTELRQSLTAAGGRDSRRRDTAGRALRQRSRVGGVAPAGGFRPTGRRP